MKPRDQTCGFNPVYLPALKTLRQLRVDLLKLGTELQSGERACCRNTGGERLRQAITSADDTLAKQVGGMQHFYVVLVTLKKKV